MVSISERDGEYVARCGAASCNLPIIKSVEPQSRREMVEIVSNSGIHVLFRQAAEVQYCPHKMRSDDGRIVTTFIPNVRFYEHTGQLLARIVSRDFGGRLVQISRSKDTAAASDELAALMRKAVNKLYREEWSWNRETTYETWVNSQTVTLLDSDLPRIPGKFVAEIDADMRLQAARALVERGVISNPCCTGSGEPGRMFYACSENGYTPVELANPLIREVSDKRRSTINSLKNAVRITGDRPSPVRIRGLERLPHATNAVVVCMPIDGDDSVIIAQSLADKLTSITERSNYYGIDELVNFHGGYRYSGRKGGLRKVASEWPQRLARVTDPDGYVSFKPRQNRPNSPPPTVANRDAGPNRDADLLASLRARYRSQWSGMIEKLGEYSAAEMKEWHSWLAHRPEWTERNKNRPMFTRYGMLGVEVVRDGEVLMFREGLGLQYHRVEIGSKLQADGDLAKGVISAILPDERMPLARMNGKLKRIQIICEAGASMKRHESLRLALGQIALYAVAAETGGVTVDPAELTFDDVLKTAVESGVYADDTLTCEVLSCEGTVSLGRFPAGVARVSRHKQDPSTCGYAKGRVPDDVIDAQVSVKAGGLVNGLPDTYCLLAARLIKCARELRSKVPAQAAKRLELLREAIK